MDTVNKLIDDIKDTHRQIQQDINKRRKNREEVMKLVENLEDNVSSLEKKSTQHSDELNGVIKKAGILFQRVQCVTSSLENMCSPVSNVAANGILKNNSDLIPTYSHISVDIDFGRREDSKSVKDSSHGEGNLPVNNSDDTVILNYSSSEELDTSDTELQKDEIKENEINDQDRAISDCDRHTNAETEQKEAIESTQDMSKDVSILKESDTNDNIKNIDSSPEIISDSKTETKEVQSSPCNIKSMTAGNDGQLGFIRARRNECGYKTVKTDLKADNRVLYKTRCSCSDNIISSTSDAGGKTEEPRSPNIRPILKAKRRLTSSRESDIRLRGCPDENDLINMDKPRTISEWVLYSQQAVALTAIKAKAGSIKRGNGQTHENILLLDTNERMRGYKFEAIKSAACEYIDGIKQISMRIGIEDNIGLAVFGGYTGLIHKATSDYDMLLKSIGELRPEGEAPLLGGLLVGLQGVLCGPLSHFGDNTVQTHVLVFTDGSSNDMFPEHDQGIMMPLSPEMEYLARQAMITGVIEMIDAHAIKVYYVPIGENKFNATMDQAVIGTSGKTVDSNEMYRLVRKTQVIMTAANIASEIRNSNETSTDDIRRKIREKSRWDDSKNDCLDMVVEFLDPLFFEKKRGQYKELNCASLQVGDRVRRGIDWRYGNQDDCLPGTVIQQENSGVIRVEWDNGHSNTYRYNETTGLLDVRKVNERRILDEEMIAVGCRVERGNDWMSMMNHDGGPGKLGTVLSVNSDGNVIVRWDCKKTGLYKMGNKGLFEVKLHDDHRNRDDSTEDYDETDDRVGQATSNVNDFDYVIPIYSDIAVSAVWEYNAENSVWQQYPSDINSRIEKAYQRKRTGKIIISIDHSTYVIHFSKMVQEDPQKKVEIPVRRKD